MTTTTANATTASNSTLAGALMIGSGVLTIMAAFGWFIGLIWVCVGVLWLIPLAVGVAEVFVGAAIMGGTPSERVRTVSVLGILAALFCGNLLGVVLEVTALVVMAKD